MRRGISGRATEIAVSFIDVHGESQQLTIADQYRIRQVLHGSFLYSSAFAVDILRDAAGRTTSISLHGAGWGHGAGLCQIGALGMSLKGINHHQILNHYFPDATVTSLYR